MRTLPPLNALRVFEVAARHMSFTKAAEELAVTPGAVSQQIKALEDFLGVPIFRRRKRAIFLTDEAQASLPLLREGFERLTEASRVLAARQESRRLTVSVAPSLAAKWLAPRLGGFQDMRPDLDVWVSADMNLVDLAGGDVDIGIRYGAGRYDGLIVERLMSEEIIPVASPALIHGARPLREPSDLRFHTLLHDAGLENDPLCPTWSMWLRAAGLRDIDSARGPKFNQSSLVIDAAIAGEGVALAKAQLARADLASGRLATPFSGATPAAFAYYIVHAPVRSVAPAVTAFKAWLHAEAGEARPDLPLAAE